MHISSLLISLILFSLAHLHARKHTLEAILPIVINLENVGAIGVSKIEKAIIVLMQTMKRKGKIFISKRLN